MIMTGQQLKNSILQEAIEGRLVPQDPNDEPASVLLERIRAEKARLVKEKKIKKDKNESRIYRTDDGHWMEHFEDKSREDVCIDEEIPFDIPDTWKWCRLRNIVSILGDGIHGTPEYDAIGEYYFINGNNLSNNRIVIKENTERVNKEEYNKYKKELNKNTILVSINGTIGNVGYYNSEPVILGKSACYFNLMDILLKPYTTLLMYTDYFLKYAKENATGSTIKNVSLMVMKNFLFPLPPLDEQHRIVEKIESLLPKVEAYGKAQEELVKLTEALPDQLKKSILQEAIEGRLVPQDPNDEPASVLLERIRAEKARLVKEKKIKKSILKEIPFTDDDILFDIPDNWVWCKLGWIGDWGAGATPTKGVSEYYVDGTIPWLRTGELNNGYVYDSEIKVTHKALEKCSLRQCKIGDVLIAMYGATIGKVAIAGIELTTNQACCACTPFEIYNKYLLYYLMASKDRFVELGEGGAQPNISREKIVAFPFPLPPLAEQHRIVEKIESLLPKIEKLKVNK